MLDRDIENIGQETRFIREFVLIRTRNLHLQFYFIILDRGNAIEKSLKMFERDQ